jgi:hypothetical protein
VSETPDAVFEVRGDTFVPTALARGPWSPDAQHGGGPAALLARAAESTDPGPASFVARLTIELLKPVPLTPLQVTARTTRRGKKVQLLECALLADGTEVARATALRIRTEALGLPRVAVDGTMGRPPRARGVDRARPRRGLVPSQRADGGG